MFFFFVFLMYMQNNNFIPDYHLFYVLSSSESSDYYEEEFINFINISSNLWLWYSISINGDFRISIIVTDNRERSKNQK